MPGLARKLLIFAAVDGLLITETRPGRPTTKIAYKDNSITQVPRDGAHVESSEKGFEAFGLVGMFAVVDLKLLEGTNLACLQEC